MTAQPPLKLVVIYDRNRNEYSIAKHNQRPDEASQFVAQWDPHLIPGCSLISLDQPQHHRTAEAKDCRACRMIVASSAHLEPRPKFRRRSE